MCLHVVTSRRVRETCIFHVLARHRCRETVSVVVAWCLCVWCGVCGRGERSGIAYQAAEWHQYLLIIVAEGPPSTSNLLHLPYFVDLLEDVLGRNVFVCVHCSLNLPALAFLLHRAKSDAQKFTSAFGPRVVGPRPQKSRAPPPWNLKMLQLPRLLLRQWT